MLLKACLIGLLWTGQVGSHRATCCLDFQYSPIPPPPPIPAFLVFGGECRIRPRQRWKMYPLLRGWDDNGKIALQLCDRDLGSPCCTLRTQDGPPAGADGRTPAPAALTGTYTCPERSGVFHLAPKDAPWPWR